MKSQLFWEPVRRVHLSLRKWSENSSALLFPNLLLEGCPRLLRQEGRWLYSASLWAWARRLKSWACRESGAPPWPLASLLQYVTVQTISGTGALRIGASFLVSLETPSGKSCETVCKLGVMGSQLCMCLASDLEVDFLFPQGWKLSCSLKNKVWGGEGWKYLEETIRKRLL